MIKQCCLMFLAQGASVLVNGRKRGPADVQSEGRQMASIEGSISARGRGLGPQKKLGLCPTIRDAAETHSEGVIGRWLSSAGICFPEAMRRDEVDCFLGFT